MPKNSAYFWPKVIGLIQGPGTFLQKLGLFPEITGGGERPGGLESPWRACRRGKLAWNRHSGPIRLWHFLAVWLRSHTRVAFLRAQCLMQKFTQKAKIGTSHAKNHTFRGQKIQHFWASWVPNIYMDIQGSLLKASNGLYCCQSLKSH